MTLRPGETSPSQSAPIVWPPAITALLLVKARAPRQPPKARSRWVRMQTLVPPLMARAPSRLAEGARPVEVVPLLWVTARKEQTPMLRLSAPARRPAASTQRPWALVDWHPVETVSPLVVTMPRQAILNLQSLALMTPTTAP